MNTEANQGLKIDSHKVAKTLRITKSNCNIIADFFVQL